MKRLDNILFWIKFTIYYIIFLSVCLLGAWWRYYRYHPQPNPITNFMLGIGSWFMDVLFPAIRNFLIG